MEKGLRRAVFIDRDGVINKALLKDNKPHSPRIFSEFEFVPAIGDVLQVFKKFGFLNIVVTNQPDISRGLMHPEELEKMHKVIKQNLPVDDIFVCPHSDEDNCVCRKPKPEMFFAASRKWKIDIAGSFFIGDSWRDIEAGKRAGCKTILIDASHNKEINTDYRVSDIVAAMQIICDEKTKREG